MSIRSMLKIVNACILFFGLSAGAHAAVIPTSLTVIPDIPLGQDWAVTSGGGFLNPPCTNTIDLTGSPANRREVTVGLSNGETDVFGFTFQFYGFGSIFGGGCVGDAVVSPIGSTAGSLAMAGSTEGFWGNGSTEIIDLNIFELYDVDFLYALDGITYELPRGYVIPVPPAIWLFGSGLLGLIGVAGRKANA